MKWDRKIRGGFVGQSSSPAFVRWSALSLPSMPWWLGAKALAIVQQTNSGKHSAAPCTLSNAVSLVPATRCGEVQVCKMNGSQSNLVLPHKNPVVAMMFMDGWSNRLLSLMEPGYLLMWDVHQVCPSILIVF